MRVIGGEKKGRKLSTFKGSSIRPTADMVREAVFNVLEPYSPFGSVLDLYAGSGGVGIEALSRGTAKAVFVERDPKAVAVINKNIESCGFTDSATVMKRDVMEAIKVLGKAGATFDLVFMDPPYSTRPCSEGKLVAETIREASDKAVLAPGAIIVAEASAKDAPPDLGSTHGVEPIKNKRYGDTAIYIYRKQ